MFLFVIPICVVLVSWQWEKRSISCLHFYIGVLEIKIISFLYSCLCCIGILAMENEFISLSAFSHRFSLLNDDDNMKFLLVRLGTAFFIF
jgi:hypothetical protein